MRLHRPRSRIFQRRQADRTSPDADFAVVPLASPSRPQSRRSFCDATEFRAGEFRPRSHARRKRSLGAKAGVHADRFPHVATGLICRQVPEHIHRKARDRFRNEYATSNPAVFGSPLGRACMVVHHRRASNHDLTNRTSVPPRCTSALRLAGSMIPGAGSAGRATRRLSWATVAHSASRSYAHQPWPSRTAMTLVGCPHIRACVVASRRPD